MRGFYVCEDCNIYIEVYTLSRHANKGYIKAKIPYCPHCKKYQLNEISKKDYDNVKSVFRALLYKIYNYRGRGDRKIKMGIKFTKDFKKEV